jgi:hypothetical protein
MCRDGVCVTTGKDRGLKTRAQFNDEDSFVKQSVLELDAKLGRRSWGTFRRPKMAAPRALWLAVALSRLRSDTAARAWPSCYSEKRGGILLPYPPAHEFFKADFAIAIAIGCFEGEQAFVTRQIFVQRLQQLNEFGGDDPAIAVAIDTIEVLSEFGELVCAECWHIASGLSLYFSGRGETCC